MKTADPDQPAFLSVPSVARRYDISRVTAWRWINEGLLPRPTYFGKTPRIAVAALDDLDRQRAGEGR